MYINNPYRKVTYKSYNYDSRFIPFAGPFLLGALTGGVAITALGPKGYNNNYYYPVPYPRPYYGPYYY